MEVRALPAVKLAGIADRGLCIRVGKAFEIAYTRMAAQGLVQPGELLTDIYLPLVERR